MGLSRAAIRAGFPGGTWVMDGGPPSESPMSQPFHILGPLRHECTGCGGCCHGVDWAKTRAEQTRKTNIVPPRALRRNASTVAPCNASGPQRPYLAGQADNGTVVAL